MLLLLLLEDNFRIRIGVDGFNFPDTDADTAGFVGYFHDPGVHFHPLDQHVTRLIQVIVGDLGDVAKGVNLGGDIDESAKGEHPDDDTADDGSYGEPALDVTVGIVLRTAVAQ